MYAISDSSCWVITVISSRTEKPTEAKFNVVFFLWHLMQAGRQNSSCPTSLGSCEDALQQFILNGERRFSRPFCLPLLGAQDKG